MRSTAATWSTCRRTSTSRWAIIAAQWTTTCARTRPTSKCTPSPRRASPSTPATSSTTSSFARERPSAEASASNQAGDRVYMARARARGGGTRPPQHARERADFAHHAGRWAAMYAGARSVALEAAAKLDAFLHHEVMLASPATPMLFELYLTTRLMVLVRFGMWDEILATPFKPDVQARRAAHGTPRRGAGKRGARCWQARVLSDPPPRSVSDPSPTSVRPPRCVRRSTSATRLCFALRAASPSVHALRSARRGRSRRPSSSCGPP
eukprot:5449832-Prymnesium_polylepis.2